MLVYWVLYLIPALGALQESGRAPIRSRDGVVRINVAWLWMALVLIIIVGCRFQVGGDWENYLDNLADANHRSFIDSLQASDPGYRLMEWLTFQLDGGILLINLLAATVFTYGLTVFCRSLPRPWLALAVAVPYLVIIVAMGYTRQGMAIGCAMVGLAALGNRQTFKFLLWILIGATFHKSAVLLFPIAAFAATRRRLYAVFWTGTFAIAAYVLMLEPAVEGLRAGYIDDAYQSQGALVRLMMGALPALLFLRLRRRFLMTAEQRQLWTYLSIVALGLFAVYFLTPASTAVDRVALYVLPLQMVVFSHLPGVLGKSGARSQQIACITLAYYVLVQFVWLNFAVNAEYWVPYRFYFLQG